MDDVEGTNGGNFLHLVVQSLELKEERSCCLNMLLKANLKYEIDLADDSGQLVFWYFMPCRPLLDLH